MDIPASICASPVPDGRASAEEVPVTDELLRRLRESGL
jgi:hypothetical protein